MNSAAEARTYRIVVVEDNAADVYLLRQALKGAGLKFELTVIEDGSEALAFARRDGEYAATPVPDLAVLDLNLPKVGGLEVLDALRHNGELSHLPVAVTTSSAAPKDQEMAIALGIDRFITKPPDLEDFLKIGEVLKQILQERGAGRGLAGEFGGMDSPGSRR